MARPPRAAISKATFEEMSEFRYRMRRFQRFSEHAARSRGVTPLQYLLLLHVKGYPGRDYAGVGELAERLQAHPHGVVALVSRCERRGLVRRRTGRTDRRKVEVRLSSKGERLLLQLALLHRAELKSSFRGALPGLLKDS